MPSNLNKSDNFYNAELPSAKDMRFGIVVSEWNKAITSLLYDGCYNTLLNAGALPDNINKIEVAGSFELPAGAQHLTETFSPDAVICLGCIIKGETSHDVYIAHAVANGIMQLNLKYNKPFVFGVLTTNDLQQAKERAGGKAGNKGIESAVTAIKMVALKKYKNQQ